MLSWADPHFAIRPAREHVPLFIEKVGGMLVITLLAMYACEI
jgi:hypothetical protein